MIPVVIVTSSNSIPQTKAKLLVNTLWIYALLGTTQRVVHICGLIKENKVLHEARGTPQFVTNFCFCCCFLNNGYWPLASVPLQEKKSAL